MPEGVLKVIFGLGLFVLAGFLLFVPTPEECQPGAKESPFIRRKSRGKGWTVVRARDGIEYKYATCWRTPGVLMAAGGGLLTGLISAGLPEVSTTQLILRCRVPPRVAVATSVFALAITAFVGAAIHALSAKVAWPVIAWSVPGVLVGSTIGSQVGRHLPAAVMEKSLGTIFGLVAALILALELTA